VKQENVNLAISLISHRCWDLVTETATGKSMHKQTNERKEKGKRKRKEQTTSAGFGLI